MDPSSYYEHFVDKDEAFEFVTVYTRILIDEYKLPDDKCKAITNAIINGNARAFTDGSLHLIGWNNFVIGKRSKNWKKAQQEYYLSINSR